jgi:hypothetical protein
MDFSTISKVNSLVSAETLIASPRAVEGGLHHASLSAPECALTGHDAVSQQDLDPIDTLALGVVAVIGQKHPLDVVGVIDDVVEDPAARREDAVDVAESAKIILQAGK